MTPRWNRLVPVAAIVLGALVAQLALQWSARGESLAGRVVSIADGDTLTLLDGDHHQTRVRLAEIDAPERGQPYGQQARQALADLAFGRDVRVLVVDHDRYGRTVGRIYVGPVDVSAEMVSSGAAWVYLRYNRDLSLRVREAEARAAQRGLWALPENQRIPPWDWRHFGLGRVSSMRPCDVGKIVVVNVAGVWECGEP